MLKMTRQQYQQKYGTDPGVSQPSVSQPTSQPIKMTRAQYEQKYGQKTPGGFAGNVLKSGGKLIGDTVGAVANIFNPNMEKNTVANVGKLALGAGSLLVPGEQKYEPMAKQVGQFYKDRYGGVENIKNTLYNDPVGALADVATVATGVGGLARGGASVASKLGSVSKASKLAKLGQTASNIGNKIDPLMVAGRGIGAVGGKISSKVKPALFSRADDMITAGIGNPAQQARAAQKGGRSISSFIDEYNLYDRSPETAGQVVKDIGEKFDTSAMSTNKNIQVSQIVKAFDDEIAKLSQGTGGQIADATAQKIAELKRRRQMFLDSVVQKSDIDIPQRQLAPDPTEALKVEARKYKSAEEFIRSRQPNKVTFTSVKNNPGYMGGHEAPMAEDINAPIWDLTGKYTGNNLYPEDIYSGQASKLYSAGEPFDQEAISILQSIKNRPNAKVTIYRAVSKEHPSKINPGDWVTLVRDYAKEHGESNLGGNYKIIKQEVSARDIFTDANSIHEFGYDPQPRLSPENTPYDLLSKAYKEGKIDKHSTYQKQLTDLYNQSQVKPQLNFTRTQAQSSPLQVPLKQATEFRRKVIDPDVPPSMYGLNPKEAGKAGGVKEARNIFRRESIKVAPELEKLGLDYGMAKELENILKKSELRKNNRQLFNFTKMGGGGLGGLAAGAPGVIGGFLIEQIVNDPRFIKYASKSLKKALEAKLPQNKLTKTAGQATSELYQAGRFGRLIGNQTQPKSANTQTLPDLQSQIQPTYSEYTPKSDLLDEIARKQGLDVNEMRKKRLNFRR